MVETDFITKIIREATAKYRKGAEEHGGYDFSLQIERNRRLKAVQQKVENNVSKPNTAS